jgi:hypothetical protein
MSAKANGTLWVATKHGVTFHIWGTSHARPIDELKKGSHPALEPLARSKILLLEDSSEMEFKDDFPPLEKDRRTEKKTPLTHNTLKLTPEADSRIFDIVSTKSFDAYEFTSILRYHPLIVWLRMPEFLWTKAHSGSSNYNHRKPVVWYRPEKWIALQHAKVSGKVLPLEPWEIALKIYDERCNTVENNSKIVEASIDLGFNDSLYGDFFFRLRAYPNNVTYEEMATLYRRLYSEVAMLNMLHGCINPPRHVAWIRRMERLAKIERQSFMVVVGLAHLFPIPGVKDGSFLDALRDRGWRVRPFAAHSQVK